MIFLKNDYSLGAHPQVMDALVNTNMELTDGYGEDRYCRQAAEAIRQMFGCPQADVHFLCEHRPIRQLWPRSCCALTGA